MHGIRHLRFVRVARSGLYRQDRCGPSAFVNEDRMTQCGVERAGDPAFDEHGGYCGYAL